ncbi:hypothetical protein SLA2020_080510 [Shorea laevis]
MLNLAVIIVFHGSRKVKIYEAVFSKPWILCSAAWESKPRSPVQPLDLLPVVNIFSSTRGQIGMPFIHCSSHSNPSSDTGRPPLTPASLPI